MPAPSAARAEALGAWLRLCSCPGLGDVALRRMLRACGGPQQVLDAGPAGWAQWLDAATVDALRTHRVEAALATLLAWLAQPTRAAGVQAAVWTWGDPEYPPAYLQMPDPPPMLYALGRIDGWQAVRATLDADQSPVPRWVAVVGSRQATPLGLQLAQELGRDLARQGVAVVSGLARGIDGAAHRGSLDAADGQRLCTVAVVGTGLDRVYPRAHLDLAHQISQNGLLLSEFPLGTPPLAHHFPRRNRLIAGLSQGTVVVEAQLKSGSLITARLALEQGREVMAVPGSVRSPLSEGPHQLIRDGAALVTGVADVMATLGWDTPPPMAQAAAERPEASTSPRHPEDPLWQALGFDPVSFDLLLARTGLDAAVLQTRLLDLELDGEVARMPGGMFQRLSRA